MALFFGSWIHLFCGNYAAGHTLVDEGLTLAEKKGALTWKAVEPNWQSFGRSPHAHLRDHFDAVDGYNVTLASHIGPFGDGPCRTRPVR